jgi:hypothetical protein
MCSARDAQINLVRVVFSGSHILFVPYWLINWLAFPESCRYCEVLTLYPVPCVSAWGAVQDERHFSWSCSQKSFLVSTISWIQSAQLQRTSCCFTVCNINFNPCLCFILKISHRKARRIFNLSYSADVLFASFRPYVSAIYGYKNAV